jgi:hypothetical protein
MLYIYINKQISDYNQLIYAMCYINSIIKGLIHLVFKIFAKCIKLMETIVQDWFKLFCIMGQILYWNR